jgi:hypothetical protein
LPIKTKYLVVIFTLLFCSFSSFGKNESRKALPAKRLHEIKKLIKKNYEFSASKQNSFIFLGGSWQNKISRKSFFLSKIIKYKKEINQKKLLTQIAKFYRNGYKIFFRKHRKFYYVEKNRFVYMRPVVASKPKEVVVKKDKEKEIVSIYQCAFCQIRLAGNNITMDGDSQLSGEVSWVPYFEYREKSGIALSFGVSSYSVEDENLEQVLSYGYKAQVLWRHLFENIYYEVGGGLHYFAEFEDYSSMLTVGTGYMFSKRHWILSRDINFNHVFFNMSKIHWELDITMYQVGVGIRI